MTTFQEAREAIYNAWKTGWGSRTEWTFENENFKEPDDEFWIRFSVRNLSGNQISLGQKTQRKYRRFGIVFVQMFNPKRKGMKDIDVHAQYAISLFEGEQIDEVYFNDGSLVELPSDEKWKPANLEINFDFEEIK